MKFKKIVSIDDTGLVESARQKLHQLADEVIFYADFPGTNQEIIKRISSADCVLVSWNTKIDREVIGSCEGLKYIGMCCSLLDEKSANVDIGAARERDIQVLGVRDYGDDGVVEYIISELVRLLKGTGRHQWRAEPLELTNQSLGIIGMGGLGKMLAETAMAFGMKVHYYNKTRKPEIEAAGIGFMELKDLLQSVDIISTHLPRNTVILTDKLQTLGTGKILINTSLEPTFDVNEFGHWIEQQGNYAIFDRVAMGKFYQDLKRYKRVIYTDKTAGWTLQARSRLSEKVVANIESFLHRE